MKVVILGAGSIGCYVAAAWGMAIVSRGGALTLIGRAPVVESLTVSGVQIAGHEAVRIGAEQITLSSEPAEMHDADVIVLAMKSHALDAAMEQIATHGPRSAVLISLLNGLAPVRRLRARFGDRIVLAGMVPFNVVWKTQGVLHKSGAGDIALEQHPVTEALQSANGQLELHADLSAVQYGKLLLNLANAVNALAGIPLYDMLMDRNFRRVYAMSIEEALKVYDAADIAWNQVGPNNPRLALRMLRAPNWIFNAAVLSRQKLDRASMTSMAGDVLAGRPTEIDTINGEITQLGHTHNIATPVNTKLANLVKAVGDQTQAGCMTSGALLAQITP